MQCGPSKVPKGVTFVFLCLVSCSSPALSGEPWDRNVAMNGCISRFILDSGARLNSFIQESTSAWLRGENGSEIILCREVSIANSDYVIFWPDISDRMGIYYFEEMDDRVVEFFEFEIMTAMRELESIYAAPVLLPFEFLLTYREVPSAHLPEVAQVVQRECLFSLGPGGVGGFSINYTSVVCFPRAILASSQNNSRHWAALRRVIRHEIFHIAQSQLLLTGENPSKEYQSRWGPHWLWEGSAMYFADVDGRLCDEDLTASLSVAIGSDSDIEDFEMPQSSNKRSDANYFAGLLSVCLLRRHNEASSLGSFYRMVAASGNWEKSFFFAFGRDYEEFKRSTTFGEKNIDLP